MSLCLLLTRRCDLRCGFCPLEFEDRDMSWETARAAVDWHLERGGGPRVKLFGGEPLLNWGVIERLVDAGRGRWAGTGLRFELPTNGTTLDAAKLAFLRAHPEVEVTLSRPAPGGPKLPGVWFTLVLSPACRPAAVVRGLRRLLADGYRRFNFLPAYYVAWSGPELARLRDAFAAASRVIRAAWDAGLPIEVRNLSADAPVPLYNDMPTVDVDGAVYASNFIHCKGIEPWLDRLRLGRVGAALDEAAATRAAEGLPRVLEQWLPGEIRRSTSLADRALDAFVESLRARA